MKVDAPGADDGTERLRRFYDESAADYDLWMESYDRWFLDGARERLCARAQGTILEVAVGTGRNLPFYPPGARLIAVDASPAMLSVARRRAEALGLEMDLRLGDAAALDLPDDCVDTVVSTLFLCTAADERRVAAEAWRVLRPGGRWLLLEPVRSRILPVRWAQRLLDPLLARFTGDHLVRDPRGYLAEIGFQIERDERAKLGTIAELVARKNEVEQ